MALSQPHLLYIHYHWYKWLDDKPAFTHRGDGTERYCSADLFSDTAALCESVWQDKPLHLCLRVVSWLWLSTAGLTHPDVVCTRPGHGWLITPYLPWQIRVLIECSLVTDPFLCPWKAWPLLWLLPRNEWLHSGPDHAVGGPLFRWLMALGCWTASRRSLLTWSDSASDCQGPVGSAANTDSCREQGASSKHTDPTCMTEITHCSNFGFTAHISSCSRCALEQGI